MKCNICEIGCDINGHSNGRCGTYISDGNVVLQNPNIGYLKADSISIETVPILHYYPSGKFLQVFSNGCNFRCPGCVTRLLSSNGSLDWPNLSPSQVISIALQQDCIGVVSMFNEPAANYYLFKELATLAKEHDLLVGCSTNCYFTDEALKELGNLLDFVCVGIKGFSNRSYRVCGVSSSDTVFRNIATLIGMGVHVEAAVVYYRGNEDEIVNVAKTLSDISSTIPMQIMRFIPFGDVSFELEPSVGEAERLCKKLSEHVGHVYLFNSPGTEMLHTYCPQCGRLLVEREYHGPMGSTLLKPWTEYTCKCGYKVPVKGIPSMKYDEIGFRGYRITRACGMVHSVLTCLGVSDDKVLLNLWKSIADNATLLKIQSMTQHPCSYLEFIRLIANKAGLERQGEELISFIKKRLELVYSIVAENEGHSVYYCMSSPLFALNAGRMENNLVDFAGGYSINKLLDRDGKPGINVHPNFINQHNPKTIFISGTLSRPLYEFYSLCRQYDIEPDAVVEQRVYAIPTSWDFGSPRWILGLLYITDKMYPGKLGVDIKKEANEFYKHFYGMEFKDATPNRSMHRPSSRNWPRMEENTILLSTEYKR